MSEFKVTGKNIAILLVATGQYYTEIELSSLWGICPSWQPSSTVEA